MRVLQEPNEFIKTYPFVNHIIVDFKTCQANFLNIFIFLCVPKNGPYFINKCLTVTSNGDIILNWYTRWRYPEKKDRKNTESDCMKKG